MSDAGLVGFANAGNAKYLTPAIWADSPCSRLNDEGRGYYGKVDFLAALVDTIAAGEQRPLFKDTLSVDCDDDTVFAAKTGERGGYQDVETAAVDNAAFALKSEPFARLVKNSGQKIWAEARLELGAIADQGLFVGLVEEAGASRDVVADDAGALIGESLIGFQVLADDQDAVDAVYRKDADAVVEVVSDASNSNEIPAELRASLAADTEIKLGVYFNGRETLKFFVNGYNVGNVLVDETVDQTKDYAFVVSLKTGTAAANSIAVDWSAYAFQELT